MALRTGYSLESELLIERSAPAHQLNSFHRTLPFFGCILSTQTISQSIKDRLMDTHRLKTLSIRELTILSDESIEEFDSELLKNGNFSIQKKISILN